MSEDAHWDYESSKPESVLSQRIREVREQEDEAEALANFRLAVEMIDQVVWVRDALGEYPQFNYNDGVQLRKWNIRP